MLLSSVFSKAFRCERGAGRLPAAMDVRFVIGVVRRVEGVVGALSPWRPALVIVKVTR